MHFRCLLAGSTWPHLGTVLGPTWPHLGAILGPKFGLLGPTWQAQRGTNLAWVNGTMPAMFVAFAGSQCDVNANDRLPILACMHEATCTSLMLLLLLLFLIAAAILLLCEQSYARTNTRHVRLHNATPTYTYLPINFWKTPRTQPHTDTYLHARTPYVHILPAATTTNHTPQ